MKKTCYNPQKCNSKSCFLCETFWKDANPAIKGLAITTLIIGAAIVGIITACLLVGVCLFITQ